jgi:hypothetical protein
MESEVSEASQVPRSELDSALDVGRARGWLVVQGVSTTPWGYELWPLRRTWGNKHFYGIPASVELPQDGERHPRDGAN